MSGIQPHDVWNSLPYVATIVIVLTLQRKRGLRCLSFYGSGFSNIRELGLGDCRFCALESVARPKHILGFLAIEVSSRIESG